MPPAVLFRERRSRDSSLDVRHRLVANGVFELPGGFLLGALVAMSTGRPFNVISGTDDNGDGNSFTDRAVVEAPNGLSSLAADLELPNGLQLRNSARQPDSFNMDLRIAKRLDVGDRGGLELLVEIFNVFNDANRFTMSTVFGSPSFGRLNAVGAPRQIQLGARYRW